MIDIQQYLQELQYLTDIDSGSYCPEGVDQVADFFADKFQKQGWHTESIQHDPAVGSSLFVCNCDPKGEFDILLSGHLDTVFPAGTVAEWSYQQQDNRITGPGVYDMRTGLLSMMYAIFALEQNESVKVPRIAVAFNSNEEIGSRYSADWLMELGKRTRYAIVTEPARADGSLVHTRRGVGRFQAEFTGIAAHSGIAPEKGASAVLELSHWIPALHDLNAPEKGTSVNVGLVEGGVTVNTVAPNGKIAVDIRFTDNSEYDKVMALANELAANPRDSRVSVKVTTMGYRPPMNATEESLALVADIEQVAREKGIPDVVFKATGGGSDANFFAHVGAITLDGLGPVGGLSHTRDEYVEADSILPRLELLTDTLKLIACRL